MADFTINGHIYRTGKMDVFAQFHVARKLGPLFAKMGPAIVELQKEQKVAAPTNGTGEDNTDFIAMLNKVSPAFEALQEMSEEDCNFVLERCLSVVQRQQGDAWALVWNRAAHRMQFEDVDMPEMLQITLNVLGDNLSSFFTGNPQTLPGQASKPRGQ